MKFAKGLMLGSMITAGAMMMYSDDRTTGKKVLLKKGKQLLKKIK